MYLLEEAYKRSKTKNGQSLLKDSTGKKEEGKEEENNYIFLTTTYHPDYTGLQAQVKKTWDLLERSNQTRPLHDLTLKIGQRRPKNLRDLIVRAQLPKMSPEGEPKKEERRKCDIKHCRYCPKISKTGTIKSRTTGRKYYAKHSVTCISKNLVYCITCKICEKQYVGQTKNTLKQRFQSHFYYIAHEAKKTEVSRHFNQANHHGRNDVEIHVLDFIHDGPHNEMSLEKRLQTEFEWIHKLRSQIPLDLNSIDSTYG